MAEKKIMKELTIEEVELLEKAREAKAKEEAEKKQKAELDKYHANIDKIYVKIL